MQVSNFVLDAVTAAIDFDIPEDVYPEAVNAQACHLAGVDSEQLWGYDLDMRVH